MPAETPNVFTYPRNEPGTTGHLDLVEPVRATPKQLAGILAGITSEEARYRNTEDGWCIQEIVGHLRDSAEVDHQRLYLMSTQTDPVLEPYDPDEYARDHGYVDAKLQDLLLEHRQFQARTVDLLTTLVNWNWARTGQHLETGRQSIRQYVESIVRHDAEHLAEVRNLRAEARTALGLD